MAMTNEMIIMDHAQQLAEEGKIAYTGNTVTLETVDGEGIVFKETEQIHAYARWKAMGFQVRKGEKAVAKFKVWKYAAKKKADDGEETDEKESRGKMFMKQAAFFSAAQVEPIQGTA